MTQVNTITKSHKGTHLTFAGLSQVFVGDIFVFLFLSLFGIISTHPQYRFIK